jgi:hypothetical protein
VSHSVWKESAQSTGRASSVALASSTMSHQPFPSFLPFFPSSFSRKSRVAVRPASSHLVRYVSSRCRSTGRDDSTVQLGKVGRSKEKQRESRRVDICGWLFRLRRVQGVMKIDSRGRCIWNNVNIAKVSSTFPSPSLLFHCLLWPFYTFPLSREYRRRVLK